MPTHKTLQIATFCHNLDSRLMIKTTSWVTSFGLLRRVLESGSRFYSLFSISRSDTIGACLLTCDSSIESHVIQSINDQHILIRENFVLSNYLVFFISNSEVPPLGPTKKKYYLIADPIYIGKRWSF